MRSQTISEALLTVVDESRDFLVQELERQTEEEVLLGDLG